LRQIGSERQEDQKKNEPGSNQRKYARLDAPPRLCENLALIYGLAGDAAHALELTVWGSEQTPVLGGEQYFRCSIGFKAGDQCYAV
jgi:hypothetical protein